MTRLALFAAVLALPPLSAPAQLLSFEDQLANAANVSLLPGYRRPDGTVMAGIQIDLAPGWKTYWRAPGDSGIAPRFDFSGSENVGDVQVHWPAPDVIDQDGIRTIGFSGQVILPIEVRPNAEGPVSLDMVMEYGICADVCVPAHAEASALLGDGLALPIDAAMAARPVPAAEAGLVAMSCDLTPLGEDFSLDAALDFAGAAPDLRAVIVEAGSEEVYIAGTEHKTTGDRLSIAATLMYFGTEAGPNPQDVRITLVGTGQSMDVTGCQPAR